MRIVAISDLHGVYPDDVVYPDGDILVIAGDVLRDFDKKGLQNAWAIKNLKPWLSTRREQFSNVILTWGNHDFVDMFGGELAMWLQADGITVAEKPCALNFNGHIIYVNPFCRQLPQWAYQASEEDLADMYKWIPMGTEVIISHGPPLDMCDKTCAMFGSSHAGSAELKKAVKKVQPKAVICGHIHEAFGTYTLSHRGTPTPTVVYNVSQMDEHYHYRHRPVVIDI